MKCEKSCGAIIILDNKVLMVQQQKGFWSFPKGHVETGETEVETAIREVKEETNLDIVIDENLRFVNHYVTENNVGKTVICFVAHPIDNLNIVAQAAEIKDIKWVDIDKVEDVLTFDNTKEMWKEVYTKISK